jgi:acyl carrier protein
MGVENSLSRAEHEYELKQVIVETLQLKDVTADTIDSEAPLFGSGLGLDSVDGLELALGIERHFGIKIEPSEEQAAKIFASVRTLAEHLEAHGAWTPADRS